jgi:hypothetical protein
MIKFPCTRIMPIFTRMQYPQPQFSGIDNTMKTTLLNQPQKEIDWEVSMTKLFCHQPIGIVTLRYWSLILQYTFLLHNSGSDARLKALVEEMKTYLGEQA